MDSQQYSRCTDHVVEIDRLRKENEKLKEYVEEYDNQIKDLEKELNKLR